MIRTTAHICYFHYLLLFRESVVGKWFGHGKIAGSPFIGFTVQPVQRVDLRVAFILL